MLAEAEARGLREVGCGRWAEGQGQGRRGQRPLAQLEQPAHAPSPSGGGGALTTHPSPSLRVLEKPGRRLGRLGTRLVGGRNCQAPACAVAAAFCQLPDGANPGPQPPTPVRTSPAQPPRLAARTSLQTSSRRATMYHSGERTSTLSIICSLSCAIAARTRPARQSTRVRGCHVAPRCACGGGKRARELCARTLGGAASRLSVGPNLLSHHSVTA